MSRRQNLRDVVETVAPNGRFYLVTYDLDGAAVRAAVPVDRRAAERAGGGCPELRARILAGDIVGEIHQETEVEERARHLADLRRERNRLLIASDIEVLPDRWTAMSPEQRDAWSTYRQALRDLPHSTTDPGAVEWPTAPTTNQTGEATNG